jgi:uncharacterized FAD-dependent dehydrogenase
MEVGTKMKYDIIIVGAGASGIFAAYELMQRNAGIKVAMLEKGTELNKRVCPIDNVKIKSCINCPTCSIMNGFGGAGGMSDGKYNITNNFGGELYKYIGRKEALDLMHYVDGVNCKMGGAEAKLYSTEDNDLKAKALRHDLHLLDAKVRHLGTDTNLIVMNNLYEYLKDKIDIIFKTEVSDIEKRGDIFSIATDKGEYVCSRLILATGRSGSKWISEICEKLGINTESNRVDIVVRVELPASIFEHITSQVYES